VLKNSLLLFTALALCAAFLFGCVSSQGNQTSNAQLANPASVNCDKIGGRVDIRTDASGGQYGMCVFSNGTECEEWKLFRGEGCAAGISEAEAAASGELADINSVSSDIDSIDSITAGAEVDLNVPDIT